MTITLYHHPFSRAAGTVWALEEAGVPYQLKFVDIRKGEQKSADLLAVNPMGKLPTLVDGDTVVSEAAAIALYLGDRYAAGKLAPALDDPRRGPYLRWSFFSPSVIEPNFTAKQQKWDYNAGQVGWGTNEAVLAAIDHGIGKGPYVLGEMFSMADVVFGGALRFMTMFKMVEPSKAVSEYIGRLDARPALQRADAKNQSVMAEHGLNPG